jgi:hypothetical protein
MGYIAPSGGSSDATKLPLAGGTMTGTITSTIGTVTVNTPALTATQTWNDAGVTFKGIHINVTSTAAASASRIVDFQLAGTSRFYIDKDGDVFAAAGFYSDRFNETGFRFQLTTSGLTVGSDKLLGWSSAASNVYAGNQTAFGQNALGVVEVNNGTLGTFRDMLVRSIIIDGAPSTAGAGQIAIGADTRTTIGANGGASALTALPVGYIDINVAGSSYQLPYYNRGA